MNLTAEASAEYSLFLDIDNFKLINDTHGHEIGDRVLKMVSRTLNASSRYIDTVGRFGGEEFIVVITNAKDNAFYNTGERLRNLVANSALDEPKAISVTVSIGGAEAVYDDTVESLLARADEKLYKAKHSGKNCICI